MDVINFDALKAQERIIKASDVNPDEDYLILGHFDPRRREFKATDYPIYLIKAGDVMGGGGGPSTPYFGDNITIKLNPGNVFSFVSTNISQFTNDTGYITISALSPYLTSAAASLIYEPKILPGLVTQYWRGDKTWQTLNTTAVPEGSNLYFTEPRVLNTLLTGLTIAGGPILPTDNVITAFGKLQNEINSFLGGVTYIGTWNATTNSPLITSGVGVKGNYYVVNVAGTTNIDGINDWQVGDWIIFNGTIWQKVDNTDLVFSVNGAQGAVVINVMGTANRISVTGGTSTTPTIDISATYAGQTSITTLGTIATGVWNATAINEIHGGTNQTSYTTGDILYASAPNVLSKLPIGTPGQQLTVVGTLPVWSSGGTGTVTTVSVLPNQGVSGTVTNPTTTPAITISLGALTGVTSFNGLVITPNTGVITTGTWNGTVITTAFTSAKIMGSILPTTGVVAYGTGVADTVTSNVGLTYSPVTGLFVSPNLTMAASGKFLSANGGGQIELDGAGTPNTVYITNDLGAFGKSWLSIDENLFTYNNYVQLAATDTSTNTQTANLTVGVYSSDAATFKSYFNASSTITKVGFGTSELQITNPEFLFNKLVQVTRTTEQLRLAYDNSNYVTHTVGSIGGLTYNAIGGATFFSFGLNGITSLDILSNAIYTYSVTAAGKGFAISNTVNNEAYFWRYTNTTLSNFGGTSLPQAHALALYNRLSAVDYNGTTVIGGNPIVNLIGTTGTNMGTRLDANGFRIDSLANIHTSNTVPLQITKGVTSTYVDEFDTGNVANAIWLLGNVTAKTVSNFVIGRYNTIGKTILNATTTGANGGFGFRILNGSDIVNITDLNMQVQVDTGFGATGVPAARVHIRSLTEQLRIGYDLTTYQSYTLTSTGILNINCIGGGTPGRINVTTSSNTVAYLRVNNTNAGVNATSSLHLANNTIATAQFNKYSSTATVPSLLEITNDAHIYYGVAATFIHRFLVSGVEVMRMAATGIQLSTSITYPYNPQTSAYSITDLDYLIDCIAGSFNTTLPDATSRVGRVYKVKNSGGGSIVVDTSLGQLIDGSPTQSVPGRASLEVMSDGANWIIT